MTQAGPNNPFTRSVKTKLRLFAKHHSLPCQTITRLISEAEDRKLPFYRRLLLRLHLYGCLACVRFQEQLRFMRALIRRSDGYVAQALSNEHSLSAEARERIRFALRRKRQQLSPQ
jgi:hypothetical protein